MEQKINKLKIITSMLIWGSIGLFVRGIELSSIEIALFRAIIGFVFLFILGLILKEEWDIDILKRNLRVLIFSGIALGMNWVLLFESYKNTTIANAIISYYMAPIFIVILCGILFKEKITFKRMISILGAMVGLFIILRNEGNSQVLGYNHVKGILYGLSAAIFYAAVVILNKYIKDLSGFKTTIIQLFISSLVTLPVALMTSRLNFFAMDIQSLVLLLIVGVLHTGIAYLLYFGSIKEVEGQSIAILSYIDPIFAIITSALLLGESMTGVQVLGGIFILGFALLSEL